MLALRLRANKRERKFDIGLEILMKKKLSLFLAVIMMAGAFSACGKKKAETESIPAPTETAAPESQKDDFAVKYEKATKRPVAVMIDNDNKDAWPHAGLSEAYLIYEITVEGSATRLMALFNETETEKIGPVRSSRHYFLDYASEHDAIYTHFGWSPKAMEDIPALGINNINGIYDAGAFWRERKHKNDYHSAFTSMKLINEQISAKSYRTDREKAPLNFADKRYTPEGDAASSVYIPFASFYSVKFEYDAESGTYSRIVNGSSYALQEGAKIAAENIIVMKMHEAPLGDGSARINISDVGSGEGYFLTAGKCVPVKWSKESRTAKTVWKDGSGNEIKLNPGQTWVEIVSTSVNTAIE